MFALEGLSVQNANQYVSLGRKHTARSVETESLSQIAQDGQKSRARRAAADHGVRKPALSVAGTIWCTTTSRMRPKCSLAAAHTSPYTPLGYLRRHSRVHEYLE